MAASDERFAVTEQRAYPTPLTIGVIADTHVYSHGARRLPDEIFDLFRRFSIGLMLHAGDVNIARVIDQLRALAPVIAVKGNNDDQVLAQALPLSVRFDVGKHRFVLLHGHLGQTARSEAAKLAGSADCVVYGHSHIPKIEQVGGTILFNPGSATDRRWQEHFGVGLIHVSEEAIKPELVLYTDPRHLENVKP
ncbi:MAG: metallophosphoesterase family protein [Thermomicrobiales bacterium]